MSFRFCLDDGFDCHENGFGMVNFELIWCLKEVSIGIVVCITVGVMIVDVG